MPKKTKEEKAAEIFSRLSAPLTTLTIYEARLVPSKIEKITSTRDRINELTKERDDLVKKLPEDLAKKLYELNLSIKIEGNNEQKNLRECSLALVRLQRLENGEMENKETKDLNAIFTEFDKEFETVEKGYHLILEAIKENSKKIRKKRKEIEVD